MSALEIVRLTPGREALFLDLFDNRGFADNPDWSGCYCRFYHYDHEVSDWGKSSAAENRAASCELIQCGTMQGWLALRGGVAVGWVNAAVKSTYREFQSHTSSGLANDEIGMITCFLIQPDARGEGLARQLMDTALADFAARGLRAVEAKPAKDPQRAASDYHGPLKMYLKAGFMPAGDLDDHNYLVRKLL